MSYEENLVQTDLGAAELSLFDIVDRGMDVGGLPVLEAHLVSLQLRSAKHLTNMH